MKRFVMILILAMIWLGLNGQLYPPIQPYQENDYSIVQFKQFALAQTELSSNWKSELLNIVNNALTKAGESVMVLDESSIYWILDHVTYERRNLVSFTNSRRIGNKIDFFSDNNYDGMVGIFNYGRCSLVIFKTRCMNLLKVPVQIIQVAPKPEPTVSFSTSKQEEDWSFSSPRKIYKERTVDLNLFKVKERERTRFFQRKIVKVGGGLLATGLIVWGGYELWNYIHNNQIDVPIIIKPVEPRTMPSGIPAVPATPTPGLPSDPRTMPGGIGKTFSIGYGFSF